MGTAESSSGTSRGWQKQGNKVLPPSTTALEGSSTQLVTNRVFGHKYYPPNGLWHLKPYCLTPWTLGELDLLYL